MTTSLFQLRLVTTRHLINDSCTVSHVPRTLSTLSAIRKGVQRTVKRKAPPVPKTSIRNGERTNDTRPARSKERDAGQRNDGSEVFWKSVARGEKKQGNHTREVEKQAVQPWKIHRDDHQERDPRPRKLPELNVEYTTPASEFIYGASSVLAALKAGHRQGYKLYIVEGEDQGTRGFERLRKFALLRGIQVIPVAKHQEPTLDRLSHGRPHNGIVLEASPLPKLPITSLLSVPLSAKTFSIEIGHQAAEDVRINGDDPEIARDSPFSRYPFVILLDGVLDPGNLGGIIRSAFFLGADAIVLSTHNAPLSSVALKASVGASESLKLLSVRSTGAFILASRQNGWKCYAAVSPPDGSQMDGEMNKRTFTRAASDVRSITDLEDALQKSPCILMLGGEGSGLKPDLIRKADYSVSILGQRSASGGVDSLNVSVAAGILCEAFLRQPKSSRNRNSATLERDLF